MNHISNKIEKEKEEIIRLLSKLIAAKTENPPGDEYRVTDIVEKEFKKAKIRYRVLEKEKGRTNIIGYIGKGKPELMIVAHADTVPAGEGWKTNPFKAVIKGDKIYGRGTNDNKGVIASLIILGKVLKKYEKEMKGTLMLTIVADEEKGSRFGIKYLIRTGIKPKYAIVPDISHNMKEISVAEKGMLNVEISSYGKQAHGSRPEQGINAIYIMNKFLNRLKKYELKYRKHKLLSRPTVNLGTINGGSAPNTVPAKCSVILNIRYLPSQKNEDIINEIKKLFKKEKLKIKILEDQPPTEIEENNELIRSIQGNAEKILNIKPTIFGLSGATVAKQLVLNNITAVGFGPGNETTTHAANEFISLRELINFTKICSLIISDLIGKKQKL